jgi:hypothetical protein
LLCDNAFFLLCEGAVLRATAIYQKNKQNPLVLTTLSPMSKHDESYKRFFSHPQMVKDLLCGFVDAPWVSQLDFSTLKKVNSEYITDKKLIKRVNDVVWKVRCQDQWLYIYILLEF